MLTATKPQAQEDFTFYAEGYDVIAKWLVFGYAIDGKRVFSYLFNVHRCNYLIS